MFSDLVHLLVCLFQGHCVCRVWALSQNFQRHQTFCYQTSTGTAVALVCRGRREESVGILCGEFPPRSQAPSWLYGPILFAGEGPGHTVNVTWILAFTSGKYSSLVPIY